MNLLNVICVILLFNLIMQLGYFDIPFHLNCPKCRTSIEGKILLENVEHYEVRGNNAYLVNEYDSNFYSVELSAEFPTRKIKKKIWKQIFMKYHLI